jgi:hypothetical protein
MNLKPLSYPGWICHACGIANSDFFICEKSPRMITFHEGECGWCNEIKSVCNPRSYHYPAPPIQT